MKDYLRPHRIRGYAVVLAAILPFINVTTVFGVDPWAPPASYYDSATGTGSVLKSQLYNIMKTGQIQRSYGDFRYSAAIHDRDPSNPSHILLVYERTSVSGGWDSGSTWNREHVWPQSRQPGSVSNGSTGNLGDPHALRPADPGTNSSRGNDPYGFATTSGNNRSVGGGVYYPGDEDRGDIARQLFYSDTRWGPDLGISLTDSSPSGNQMGYLSALVAWNYLDPPDEFERRRNHTIYSSAYNPSYYTNNRNAYIDHPEFVWSIYVDQQNDSQLSWAPGPDDPSGGSLRGFSVVTIVGPTTVLDQTLELDKSGLDGTYYEVSTTGHATSSVTGRYNAFATSTGGTASRNIDVALSIPANQPGSYQGQVVIDNLDVTTSGGPGHGGQDDNDVVNLVAQVLASANASFDSNTDDNSIDIDLGAINQGGGDAVIDIPVYNLASAPGFTAKLDIEYDSGSGDTSALVIDSMLDITNVDAGVSANVQATLSDAAVGAFSATYTLRTFDQHSAENWQEGTPLTIHLTGEVLAAAAQLGDMNCDGVVDFDDVAPFALSLADAAAYGVAQPGCDIDHADLDQNSVIDGGDIAGFVELLVGP